jgi:hypothetical protein
VELHQRRHSWRGALLQFEWLRKTRGAQALRLPALRRKATVPPRGGGAGGEKPLLYHNSQAPLSIVQEEAHSCARDQVVIARPPVLTPPRCYRRSLVSKGKGRFTISINVICVRTRSSLPKRRYRVVIDYAYVGGPLHHRGKAGCRLFRGTCANLGKQRVACGFSWLLRVIDHEAVLLDPNLFSSLVHRSVVLLKRRFGRHRQASGGSSREKMIG